MKIGFSTSLFMPDTGGAEIFLDRLMNDLQARGHEVSLVAPARWGRHHLNYPVVRSLRPFSKRLLSIQGLPALLWSWQRHRFEILHCHGELAPVVAGQRLKSWFGVPYVCRALGGGFASVDTRPYLRPLVQRALTQAGCLFAQGEFLRSRIREQNVPEDRIETINNGVRIEEITRYRDAPCPVAKPYLLFVGGLRRVKGWDVALKALAKIASEFPSLTLVIAGGDKQRAAYEQLTAELGLQKQVAYVGLCDRPTIANLFCNAELYLCPFRRSPFSNANLEAMAGSTPVVATAVDGNSEQVRDGVEGFLFPVDDVDRMADAMGRILRDDALRSEMAANAFRRAEHYSWDRMVDRYEAAYERVLAEHRRGAAS